MAPTTQANTRNNGKKRRQLCSLFAVWKICRTISIWLMMMSSLSSNFRGNNASCHETAQRLDLRPATQTDTLVKPQYFSRQQKERNGFRNRPSNSTPQDASLCLRTRSEDLQLKIRLLSTTARTKHRTRDDRVVHVFLLHIEKVHADGVEREGAQLVLSVSTNQRWQPLTTTTANLLLTA